MVIDAEFLKLSSIYFNFKIIIPIFLSNLFQAVSKSLLDLFFEKFRYTQIRHLPVFAPD